MIPVRMKNILSWSAHLKIVVINHITITIIWTFYFIIQWPYICLMSYLCVSNDFYNKHGLLHRNYVLAFVMGYRCLLGCGKGQRVPPFISCLQPKNLNFRNIISKQIQRHSAASNRHVCEHGLQLKKPSGTFGPIYTSNRIWRLIKSKMT
jgi:hypothetical protein